MNFCLPPSYQNRAREKQKINYEIMKKVFAIRKIKGKIVIVVIQRNIQERGANNATGNFL